MSGRRVLAGRSNGIFSRFGDAVSGTASGGWCGPAPPFFVGATIPVAALINVLTGRAPRAGQHRLTRDHPNKRTAAPLAAAPCRRGRSAFARIRARVPTPAAPRWPRDISRLCLLVLLDFWSRRSRRFTFSRRGPAVTQVGRARRRPRRRTRNQTLASALPRFWRPVFALGKCPWWPVVRKDPLGRCEGAPRASMRVAVGRRCCVRAWSFCGASSKCALRAP